MSDPVKMHAAVEELTALSPESRALALLLVAFLTNDKGGGAEDVGSEALGNIAFLIARQGERAYRVHEEIQQAYIAKGQQPEQ